MKKSLIKKDPDKLSLKNGKSETNYNRKTLSKVNACLSAYVHLLGPLVGLDFDYTAADPIAYEKMRMHLLFPDLTREMRNDLVFMAMTRRHAKDRVEHLMKRNRAKQCETDFVKEANDYFKRRDWLRKQSFIAHLTDFQLEFLQREVFSFPLPDFRDAELAQTFDELEDGNETL
jgi:hypothetical protein